MPIEYRCNGCDERLRVPDEAAGQQSRCPKCGEVSLVSATPNPAARADWEADLATHDSGGHGLDAPHRATPTVDNPYASPVATQPLHGPTTSAKYLRFPLASRSKRLVGSILDGLIHLAGMAPGFIALVLLGDADETVALIAMILMFGGLAAVAIYNWILISRTGQSIAKRMLGMRIVTTDGELPGFVGGVLLRLWLPMIINQFCGLFGIVDALVIFGEPRRCVHDYMASTIVVEELASPETVHNVNTMAEPKPEPCPWCEEQVLPTSDGFCPACNRPIA